jgi:energy-coupling factor transporter ATP-binding protein EcfA2
LLVLYKKKKNMAKKFNITGNCFYREHYMADVSRKLTQVRKMIDEGEYFIINRPRQYGKTTMLYTLTDILNESGEYIAFNISFEGIGDIILDDETLFSEAFVELLADETQELKSWLLEQATQTRSLKDLSEVISRLGEKTHKKTVILIDEVDKFSNNQLFISFLAMLRNKYLSRGKKKTFHSVILAGVHDVKSLKLKIRDGEEAKLNSPWNIAAEFKVDMNLQPFEIKPMLDDYVADKGVKMDTAAMAEGLFYYTSGYPFLVSKLCKMLDEDVLPTKDVKEWTEQDLELAVRQLVGESNSNFDTLIKNLDDHQDLYNLVYDVAVDGRNVAFNAHELSNSLGVLYGIFGKNNRLSIHNRIYREVIVNYMTANMNRIQRGKGADFGDGYVNPDKTLKMELALLKFQAFMREQYSKQDRDFLERNGRLVFLAFMKPILNGHGYDFKEVQVSEERRLDVTITFYQHKYVAELKVWRGQVAHEEGLNQLDDYLDRLKLTEGYLLIFDHSAIKTWHSEWIEHNEKKIFIVWV